MGGLLEELARMKFKDFSPLEHKTWHDLFERQAVKRPVQMIDLFSRGLEELKFSSAKIPDLEAINTRLSKLTGFKGVAVKGFEDPAHFFEMLTRKEFPIGNFIRDAKDLSYTPEPDVFHDLYGHIPFFIDKDYSGFCEAFGHAALKFRSDPEALKQFDRLFWFTIEFALIETTKGRRIFGAGIASSYGECAYSLGSEPEVIPFDLDLIRRQDFKIDVFQKRLFILKNEAQLYGCLPEFEKLVRNDPRPSATAT
jgi:phenylalanine-4-hydroxylase